MREFIAIIKFSKKLKSTKFNSFLFTYLPSTISPSMHSIFHLLATLKQLHLLLYDMANLNKKFKKCVKKLFLWVFLFLLQSEKAKWEGTKFVALF